MTVKEKTCDLCGQKSLKISRDKLSDMGWTGIDIRSPIRKSAVFCPNHSAQEIAIWVAGIMRDAGAKGWTFQ